MQVVHTTETLVATPERFGKLDMFALADQAGTVDSFSPPHAAEYVAAQQALAQGSAALQLLDDDIEECRKRIERAQAQMRLLERQRDAVERHIFIHRARLSPVRVVPDQILQEIFQYCLPDSPYVLPDTRSAPLVLTHVCRRWRVVAQGTSELWSSIALHDRGIWNYDLDLQMVKQWLDRSRMRPMHMSITCAPRTDFGQDQNVLCSDIFQLVMAHSSQLRDLSLNVNQIYLYHLISRANLAALQSIVISLHSPQQMDEPPELNMPTFNIAPNLRRIALKGDGSSLGLIPRTIFPQITHLFFDCHMTLDLALLFRNFPNLQDLSLCLSDALHFQLPPQLHHRVVSPSILRLDVHLHKEMLDFGDPEYLEELLDQLELPALQTLSITAPLSPRNNIEASGTEASWENHVACEWLRSSSIASLLSRSRYAATRFEPRLA